MPTIIDNIRSKVRETGARNGAGGLGRKGRKMGLEGAPVRARIDDAVKAFKADGAVGLAKNGLEFPMVRKMVRGAGLKGPASDLVKRIPRPGGNAPSSPAPEELSVGSGLGDVVGKGVTIRVSD